MKDEFGVVVGYEDSPSAREALRWGAAEAAVRRPAQRLVKAAAGWVRRHHSDVVVNTLTDRCTPGKLLVELSMDAELIVVGCRGFSALGGLMAGSVSGHVAAHATCPVIVMRGPAEARGARDVVMGFDSSRTCAAALGFAAGETVRPGGPLKVVIAYQNRGRGAGMQETRIQTEGLAWNELTLLERRFPDLQASVELVDDSARPALLEVAGKARLLVVGSRGLGEVRGLLLESVSQALVHQASCPVAVVHAA
ncbi:universal stress protein [Nonomuraea jabiensis]|uniref:universal stress protein n=1 Tax=Nonomuraea jabiensis TaxID=882448 RepID=UPI003D707A32